MSEFNEAIDDYPDAVGDWSDYFAQPEPCPVCDGTGWDDWNCDTCQACDGEGIDNS